MLILHGNFLFNFGHCCLGERAGPECLLVLQLRFGLMGLLIRLCNFASCFIKFHIHFPHKLLNLFELKLNGLLDLTVCVFKGLDHFARSELVYLFVLFGHKVSDVRERCDMRLVVTTNTLSDQFYFVLNEGHVVLHTFVQSFHKSELDCLYRLVEFNFADTGPNQLFGIFDAPQDFSLKILNCCVVASLLVDILLLELLLFEFESAQPFIHSVLHLLSGHVHLLTELQQTEVALLLVLHFLHAGLQLVLSFLKFDDGL